MVRLCREHGLYGALIYLFNRGLDDFKTPLEELLVVLQNNQKLSPIVIGYVTYSICNSAFIIKSWKKLLPIICTMWLIWYASLLFKSTLLGKQDHQWVLPIFLWIVFICLLSCMVSGNRYRMLVYLKYCFLGLAFPPGMKFKKHSWPNIMLVRWHSVYHMVLDIEYWNSLVWTAETWLSNVTLSYKKKNAILC